MPRRARERSESGIYHVMVRGINRQDIFKDDSDRKKYLYTLRKIKKESPFDLYAYCLMPNHVHLVIREDSQSVSDIMKRVGSRYVIWYNGKYERVGHLFQDRFKSEKVESDDYLLTVVRYVHQNPVKAKMVGKAGDYRWSSYGAYLSDKKDRFHKMVDTEFFLNYFGEGRKEQISGYVAFMNLCNDDICLDDVVPMQDNLLSEYIRSLLKGAPMEVLHTMDKKKRDEIIRHTKQIEGVTERQIARITGLGRHIIGKA